MIAGACGAGSGEAADTAWAGSVRDSAGNTIVENAGHGLWPPAEQWTAREDLRVGVRVGAPEYQFGQIADVAVDSAGRMFVLDGQARVVRVYDPACASLREIGSPGQGSGELSDNLSAVLPAGGDTLYVADRGHARVQKYLSDGTAAGTFPIPGIMAGMTSGWTMTRTCTFVHKLRRLSMAAVTSGKPGPPGMIVERASDGTITDTLLVFPRGEIPRSESGGSVMRVLAPKPVWTLLSDGRLVSGVTSDYRLNIHAVHGSLDHVATMPFTRVPVTESDRETFNTRTRALFREQAEGSGNAEIAAGLIKAIFDDLSFADYYPVFIRLTDGPNGTIWVQGVRSIETIGAQALTGGFDPGQFGAPKWDVFDASGRYLGAIELPDRFQLMDMAHGHIYGVWQDELGVQYVLRLEIVRPGNDAAA